MGRRRGSRQLTPLELEIMKVLWETGPATVQTVQERLPGSGASSTRLAYTTVQTMLNVLYRKGKVKRTRKDRAYEYEPVVSREKATTALLRDIINRLFGGSAERLVMSLVQSHRLSAAKLTELKKLIEQSEASAAHKAKEASHGND